MSEKGGRGREKVIGDGGVGGHNRSAHPACHLAVIRRSIPPFRPEMGGFD
jgi:hypothetical protein